MKHTAEQELSFQLDPEYRRLKRVRAGINMELIVFAQKMARLISSGHMVVGDDTWVQWQTKEADPIRERLEDVNEEINRFVRFWGNEEARHAD